VYLDDPCTCPVCRNPDADATRQEAGCDLRHTTDRAARLFATYRTYVERGNTPLIDLPPWVAEVARLAAYFEGLSQKQRHFDRQEKQKCQSLQRQYGMT
jgi:hypothetical protein